MRKIISWRKFRKESLIEKFSVEDWHKILSDIDKQEEFNELLKYDCVKCFVAYHTQREEPFAFVFTCTVGDKIFVHGGGWTANNTLNNYTALIILLERFFKKGLKVRTSCLVGNDKAFRFLHSVGFIKYYSSSAYHYMWLPYKRFVSTPIYKRIKQRNGK